MKENKEEDKMGINIIMRKEVKDRDNNSCNNVMDSLMTKDKTKHGGNKCQNWLNQTKEKNYIEFETEWWSNNQQQDK